MKIYRLIIRSECDVFDVWNKVLQLSFEPLYSESDQEGQEELFIRTTSELVDREINSLSLFISKIELTELPAFDWSTQWQQHAPGYDEGRICIDLKDYGADLQKKIDDYNLQLVSGAGFGDLSHPTTRMVLMLLCHEDYLKNNFLDIGTGSGILAIAAARLGAEKVWGIDIEEEALIHAKKNVLLNELTNAIMLSLPEDLCIFKQKNKNICAAMNMISSEQRIAWSSLNSAREFIGTLLVSGILIEEKKGYLEMASDWGFSPEIECQEGIWISFKLVRKRV